MENIIFVYGGNHIEHCRDVAELPGFITVGTHRQDTIAIPYSKLVEVFGEPNAYEPYEGDAVDAEWCILTLHGVATLYNYKDGKNYLGEEGTPTEKITDWHISGHTQEVVTPIKEALGIK